MATKTKTNPFAGYSAEQLADAIGALDVQSRAIASQEKLAREEYKARGLHRVKGFEYEVLLSQVEGERVDTKSLRADLGTLVNRYLVPTFSWRFTVKASEKLAVVA